MFQAPHKRVVPVTFAFAVLLSIVVTAGTVGAQDKVDLLPRWRVGERLRFEVAKSRRRKRENGATLNATTRTDLNIQVIEASERSFVLRLTYGEVRFDDPEIAATPLAKQTADILRGLQIVLDVTPEGGITGVRNWQELQTAASRVIDALMRELRSKGLDAAALELVRAQVARAFSTRESVEQMTTRDAQMLFVVLGRSYTQAQPIEYTDELPNPLGGESLPTRASFTFDKLDPATKRATISWRQSVEPAAARRIIENTVREMARRVGKTPPDGELLKSLTIDDKAEFTVDVATGWVQKLTHTRSTATGDNSQQETLAITRK